MNKEAGKGEEPRVLEIMQVPSQLLYYFLKKYLFIYLDLKSRSTWDPESSLQHVGSSSLTRDGTQAPCIGSSES